ncbi:MAG: hypothetical protein JJ992_04175, partial [Planctomycetes bacterium]|nr:hypothetical protein [Planctomycetota bacterium]
VPVTFGQVFRKGDIGAGQTVRCSADTQRIQVDEKRRYDDGSLRFAVVSTIVQELNAGGSQTLTLTGGTTAARSQPRSVSADDLLPSDFDAVVTLKFPDGAERSISARKLMQDAGDRAPT